MAKKPKHHPELTGERCGNCNGSGSVIVNFDGLNVEANCPECHGTGLVNSPNACTKCHGSGCVIIDIGGLNFEANCDHCSGSGLEPK